MFNFGECQLKDGLIQVRNSRKLIKNKMKTLNNDMCKEVFSSSKYLKFSALGDNFIKFTTNKKMRDKLVKNPNFASNHVTELLVKLCKSLDVEIDEDIDLYCIFELTVEDNIIIVTI